MVTMVSSKYSTGGRVPYSYHLVAMASSHIIFHGNDLDLCHVNDLVAMVKIWLLLY